MCLLCKLKKVADPGFDLKGWGAWTLVIGPRPLGGGAPGAPPGSASVKNTISI